VRDALYIQTDHPLANQMMIALRESAHDARNTCIRRSLDECIDDALASINLAIKLYPIDAEFHLQR
jgi:hypothetical protein